MLVVQGCPYPPEEPPMLPWPNTHVTLKQAFWAASITAFHSWLLSVERAALRGTRRVHLGTTKFHVGPHEIHWLGLVHGISRKTGRDRSFWHQHNMQMPFEEVRNASRLRGEYVVLTYTRVKGKLQATVLRFTMQEIMGSCQHMFTVHKIVPRSGTYKGRECHVFVYGKQIEWHTLNIVPF